MKDCIPCTVAFFHDKNLYCFSLNVKSCQIPWCDMLKIWSNFYFTIFPCRFFFFLVSFRVILRFQNSIEILIGISLHSVLLFVYWWYFKTISLVFSCSESDLSFFIIVLKLNFYLETLSMSSVCLFSSVQFSRSFMSDSLWPHE